MADKPNLSQIASSDWGNFDDLDNIIASENKSMTAPTSSAAAPTTSAPPTYAQPTPMAPISPRMPTIDPRDQEYKDILSSESSALDPNIGDSGTVTPQQFPNQGETAPQTDPQQGLEDNSDFNDGDPYILAFNILQEFDMIRLPENVDYSKLDLNTLSMYKEETLQMQRDEALDFVRGQVSYDPLMSQLFDYSYHGRQFADLPRMQNILKEEFDYANYDITSEKAQKAIVKLYHADGLNPKDNRDNAILRNLPGRIDQLAIDLKLKAEAQIAKQYFMGRAQEKAQIEEDRVLALMYQQDQIEVARINGHNDWNHNFSTELDKRKWSDGKKNAVAREASTIQLDNGKTMPLWQYKQEIIFDNPALFQMFLDFTSKFDLDTGLFQEDTTDDIPQGTLNQIVQRLQRKSNTSKTTAGNRNPQGPNQTKQPRVADVNKNWF